MEVLGIFSAQYQNNSTQLRNLSQSLIVLKLDKKGRTPKTVYAAGCMANVLVTKYRIHFDNYIPAYFTQRRMCALAYLFLQLAMLRRLISSFYTYQ